MDTGKGDQRVLLCLFFIRNADRGRSVCRSDFCYLRLQILIDEIRVYLDAWIVNASPFLMIYNIIKLLDDSSLPLSPF